MRVGYFGRLLCFFTTAFFHYFHIDHNAPCSSAPLPPPPHPGPPTKLIKKIIVIHNHYSSFSWVLQTPQEKSKAIVMQNFVGKHGESDNRLVKSWFFPVHFFKNLNIKHLIHPIVIEILPLWHLRFYGSLVRFKKLRVTCLSWLIWTMTSCAAPKNIRLHSFPCCPVPLVWVGILVGKGNTTLYQSIAVCFHLTNSATHGYRLVLKILILQYFFKV